MRFGPLDIRFNRETKASETWRVLTSIFGMRQPVWTPRDYENFAREGYQSNVPVYRCVNLIADGCSGIPWKLYRKTRGGKREEVEEGEEGWELLDRLRRPNPEQGGASFITEVISYLMLSGNTYVEGVGPDRPDAPPEELYALRPDRMRIVPGNAVQRIGGYVYKVSGREKDFRPEQVLHYKLFNPLNDWYGMAPIEAAAKSIDQNNSSRSWNVSLVQNSARPPGIYSMKEGVMDEDSYLAAQAQIKEANSGPKNAGKTYLLDSAVDWKPTAYSPAEMDWTGGIKLSTREIAIAFNVPPEMVGDTEAKTHANYEQARKSFYNETILPLMDGVRDGFNNWLTPRFGDKLYLDYDRDDIEALREDQGEVWKRANESPDLTLNEKREMKGFGPIPGGDVLIVPKGSLILPSTETDLAQYNALSATSAPADGEEQSEKKPPKDGKAAIGEKWRRRAQTA